MDGRKLLLKALGKEEMLSVEEETMVGEMDRFLRMQPDDTNFVLELTPGTAYGQVVCMEESCFTEINLEPSPLTPDGGHSRGFGWMGKYQEHIKNSPEHVQARIARVANEAAIKSERPPDSWTKSSSAKKAASASTSSSGTSVSASKSVDKKPDLSSALGFPSSSSSTKPSSSALPKKRTSDLGPRSSAGNLFEDDDIVDKKPRLDVAPGVFAERQNATAAGGAAAAGVSDTAAAVLEYKGIKDKVERWKVIVDEITDTPLVERTPDDYLELDQAKRELDLLKEREASWRARHGAAPAALAVTWPNTTSGAAVPRQMPALGGIGGNALAGPSSGVGSVAAAVAAAKNAAALLGGAARGGDTDDDEERMWGNFGNLSNEDFDNFIKAATEGDGFEGNENVNNAAISLGLKSQKDKLPNMTVTLLPHQLIGVTWMKKQEEGRVYGGLLGDEMGLGKTVEAIATCLINESGDPSEKTTLVVAPLALLEQWKEELETKVEKNYFSVAIYHGPDRRKYTKKKLLKHDFVLTTYQTLVGEYPNEEGAMKKAQKQAKKEGGVAEDYLEFGEKGPLLQISWYRVILDEAQSIRNRNTQISRACCDLDSIYRWALTGTPVTNSLSDLYPIFRFLQIRPWFEWSYFRERVASIERKYPDVAGKRAQTILRTCMLRRKKNSTLDGKELISLPPKNVDLHEIEFSEEEREVYTMIETRAQQKFNKFLKAGTVLKNYAHVLVLLLRLRQVCFHPALVMDAEQTLANKENAKEKNKDEITRAADEVGMDFVNKVKKQRLELAVSRENAEESGENPEEECSVCMESPEASETGGIVTKCRHIFCRLCIEEVIKAPMRDDHDDEGAGKKCKANQRPCPICRQPIGVKDIYTLQAFEPSDFDLTVASGKKVGSGKDDDEDDTLGGFIVNDDEESDDEVKSSKKKTKAPSQPNRRVIQDSDDEHSEAEEVPEPSSSRSKGKGKQKEKSALEVEFMKSHEPSAKMLWLKAKLDAIFRDSPDDKVILISSFTSALDIAGEYLTKHGYTNTRYQGDMNREARDEALRILKKSKKCKIMLLSLKAGGVGLTLTRANRIIALDLAWSPAVEQQAFDRVHRIGQDKEVFVDRLTIANSVEQRILDLQSKKQSLADAAFGEGKAQKFGKLTVAELAGLFNLNVHGQVLN
ncbi:hypothetical protein JCM6882_006429 [Rhodosporidiobolus microsporus]